MSITSPCLCLRHNELHRGDFAPHLCQSVAFWCPPCRSDPVRRSLECLLSPTQLGKGSNPNPSRSCPLSGLSGREFVFPGQRHCLQCHHPSALSAPGPASRFPHTEPRLLAKHRPGVGGDPPAPSGRCHTPSSSCWLAPPAGQDLVRQTLFSKGGSDPALEQGCVTQGCV